MITTKKAVFLIMLMACPLHAIKVNKVGFEPSYVTGRLSQSPLSSISQSSKTLLLMGKPLNYPNPFQLKSGSFIGYRLNMQSNMNIYIYNPFGIQIKKIDIKQGGEGGKSGYNRVNIDLTTFDNVDLPAGPYPYIIKNNDTVMGKGVMMIKP